MLQLNNLPGIEGIAHAVSSYIECFAAASRKKRDQQK